MKPSIGRIVHFVSGGEHMAALIVAVHSETIVTVAYWNHGGTQSTASSVPLDETGVGSATWHWPERVD